MARSKSRAPAGSEGFTLLEILVAFAILSVALAGIFGSFQSGARQMRSAESAALRVLEARSIIDAALAAPDQAAGVRSGTTRDGAGWRLTVEPIPVGVEAGGAETGRAYGILLEIIEDGRTVLVLETVGVGS